MRPSTALAALLCTAALTSCRTPGPPTPPAPPTAGHVDCPLVAPDGRAVGRLSGPDGGPWRVDAGGRSATLDPDGTLRSPGAPDLHLGPVGDPCPAG